MKLNRSFLVVWILAALAAVGSSSASAQTNRIGPKEFTDFDIITKRNIFDPNRRPPQRRDVPAAPRVVESFALTGTMSYDNSLYAVFDGNNSDYHKVLGSGARIASYTVSAIGHDFVKLTSGTNEVELKVGMQMQRGQDGKWSTAQRSEGSFAFSSNNNNRRTRNNDRGNDRNSRFNSFGGRNNQNGTNNRFESGMTDQTGGAQPVDAGPGVGVTAGDPTDPIVRMMLRRQQETGDGGNQGDNENQGGQGDNQNGTGNPNDNRQPGDEPVTDENQPNGERPVRNDTIPNGEPNGPQNPN